MQQARKLPRSNRLTSLPQPVRQPAVYPQPGSGLRKFKFIVILITCFALSLAVVGQYSSLVIYNYRLSGVRAEVAAMQEITRELEFEAARFGSISRIEHIAREELGMVEPGVDQVRVVTAGRRTVNRLGE